MIKIRTSISLVLSVLLILSCNDKSGSSTIGESITKASVVTSVENHLRMKINGAEWVADHGIFGAFHPKGYNKAIIIGGSKGPKNESEQVFDINIYNTEGPGTYNFHDGNPELSAAQMANWSTETFLCGSMMGHNMHVNVSKASTNPAVIEATFEGNLTCNSGEVFHLTDGTFYYHE